MSHRTERASDFTETDARSTFAIWRMLASEIRAHFSPIRSSDRERSRHAGTRGKGFHERWFVVEVLVVAILGGTVLICAGLLVPVLWTAVRDNVFRPSVGQYQAPNLPGGMVTPGRDTPAK